MGDNKQLRVKMQKIAGNIQQNKYVTAISNGLASTMPMLLGGAIFSMIDTINIPAYQSFLVSTGLKNVTGIPALITTNLISLYAVFAIAYALASQFKKEGFAAGLIALMSFLIVTPIGTLADGQTNALSFTWLGAQGFFVAMIVALVVARIYVLVLDKGVYIKMPKGVPPTIEKSFAAIAPAMVAILLMLTIRGIFTATKYGDIHTFIFSNLQTPLTKLGGSWWAYLICVFIMSFLWFLGVHGTMVVLSVMMPVWLPLGTENLVAFQKGLEIPHLIPGLSFFMIYGNIGGACAAIGLPIAMLFARSKRYKILGKLAIVPGITCINEPVIFGMPLVFNTRFLIPLILTPLMTNGIAIALTALGIVPKLRGIGVPLGTPLIVSGFIEGGWRVALLQGLLIILSFVIFYPFFKKADNEAYDQEVSAEKTIASEA